MQKYLHVGSQLAATVFLFSLALFSVPLSSPAALEISNGAASSISSTGAVLACSLTATNSTNTTLTCYYGTGAGGTNTAWWQYSNQLGIAVSLTTTSITISNLSPATYYYYRWKAVGTNTAWAAAASNFSTLATLGTNFPAPGTNGISVQAQTNGHLLAPLHFFSANLDLMLAAGLSSSGDVSTVQSNLDNHANATGTNVHGLGSAAVEDAGAFDAAGAASAIGSNLTDHTNATGTNVHGLGSAAVEDAGAFDAAGAASAIGTNLASHTNAIGTNVHGLGSAAVEDAGAFDAAGAASAIGTNLAAHTNATGTNVHGLGSAAVEAAGAFDAAGAASAIGSNLTDHTNATGTNVHGLGSAAVEDVGAFDAAGSAAGVQTNLNEHTNATGTNVHGLGSAALEDASAFDGSGWSSRPATQAVDMAYNPLRNISYLHITNGIRWDAGSGPLSVSRRGSDEFSYSVYGGATYSLMTMTNSGDATAHLMIFDPWDLDTAVPTSIWGFSNQVVIQRINGGAVMLGIGRSPITPLDVRGVLWGDTLSGSNVDLSLHTQISEKLDGKNIQFGDAIVSPSIPYGDAQYGLVSIRDPNQMKMSFLVLTPHDKTNVLNSGTETFTNCMVLYQLEAGKLGVAINCAPDKEINPSSLTVRGGINSDSIVVSNQAVSNLTISAGNPTNGSTLVAMNTAGEGAWMGPVAFNYSFAANMYLTNNVVQKMIFGTKSYDYGENFNGTTFTAPRKAVFHFILNLYASITGGTLADSPFTVVATRNDSVAWYSDAPWFQSKNDIRASIPFDIFLTNGATVYFSAQVQGASTTNTMNSGALNQITGYIATELP